MIKSLTTTLLDFKLSLFLEMPSNIGGWKILCTPRVFPPYGHSNITEKPIYNWANISTFMVNFTHGLRRNPQMQEMSVLDLKAHYHGIKYVKEVFKLLPDFADKLLIHRVKLKIANLGAINCYSKVA